MKMHILTAKKKSIKHVTNTKVSIRSIYSVIIALLPVIMIFNVPFINLGFSTVLLGIFAPYALLRYRKRKKAISIIPVFCMLTYMILRADGSLSNQFLLVIVLIHVYGAVQGSLNMGVIRKTLEIVAVIASFAVLLQTVIYYIFGIKFMYLFPEIVLQDNWYYFTKKMGTLYRPSAFFLEPSHYAQYCCLGLLSSLFPTGEEKVNFKKVFWIMFGCLLTTSGMGIALCVGIFGWYVLFTRRKLRTQIKSILGWGILAIVAFCGMMQIPFFRLAVERVLGQVDGYNAIWGRTLFWDTYIGSMSRQELIVGKGVSNLPDGYMTGLMEVIYCYGYLGVGIMLLVFIYMFIRGKDNFSRSMCVIYCSLMCVANLFGFLSLSFWLCCIITQCIETDKFIFGTRR